MSPEQLRTFTGFLGEFGRPTGKWWQQHISAVVTKLDLRGCRSYLTFVTDAEAKSMVQQRLDEISACFDAKATMRRIVAQQSWNPEDIQGLEATSADFYREWFQTEEGDLLVELRSFLEIWTSSPTESVEGKLHHKLVAVLRELANESLVNQMRVNGVLRLSLQEPTTPDTQFQGAT